MAQKSPTETILELDAELNRATVKRIVPRLPQGELEENKQLDPNIRRVIIDRLVHLQYLSSRQGVNNIELTNAIFDLQSEAGLATDRWLGFQTWQAIQQVFTFEEPTHLERWIVDETPSQLIIRAAYVRLRALGIIEGAKINFTDKYNAFEAPVERKYAVDQGLTRFREILLLLGYDSAKLKMGEGYHLGLFEVLFDHDELIQRLLQKRRHIVSLLKDFPLNLTDKQKASDKKGEKTLKSHTLRFLCYLSKIELWLHDYSPAKKEADQDGSVISPKANKISFSRVLESPGGKRLLRRSLEKDPRSYEPRYVTGFLGHALQFCKDSGVPKNTLYGMRLTNRELLVEIANDRITHVHIALDILTCAAPSITMDIPKPEQAQRLLKSLQQQNSNGKLNQTDVWESAGFGNSILDGAKRMWRFAKDVISWIVNKVKKMYKAVTRRISQVVRIAKKFAFEGLAILQRAYVAMEMGARLLFNAEIPGSNKFIAMKKDIDMDFTVAVSELATPEHISTFLTRLKQGIEGFQFSVVLVKVVIAAIGFVVSIYAMPITGPLAIISKLLTIERFLDDHDYEILHKTLLVK